MKQLFQRISPFRAFLIAVLFISLITHSHERYCAAGHRHKSKEVKVFGAGRVDLGIYDAVHAVKQGED